VGDYSQHVFRGGGFNGEGGKGKGVGILETIED